MGNSSASNNSPVNLGAQNKFAVATENGNVLVCDAKSNHLMMKCKMNSAARQLAFHPSKGNIMYSADREGHIYEWDLRNNSKCLNRFRNESCVELFSLAAGRTKQGRELLATGS